MKSQCQNLHGYTCHEHFKRSLTIIDKCSAGSDVLQVVVYGVAHLVHDVLCVNVDRRLTFTSAFIPPVLPHNWTWKK